MSNEKIKRFEETTSKRLFTGLYSTFEFVA